MLFEKTELPRTKFIKRMVVVDAGNHLSGGKGIAFECKHCGHKSGWILDCMTVSQNKRGLPCPECNAAATASPKT
jgi:DNA-directed RNA polymerase subunit RPC12/RpoP